jgi:hypothetical protein
MLLLCFVFQCKTSIEKLIKVNFLNNNNSNILILKLESPFILLVLHFYLLFFNSTISSKKKRNWLAINLVIKMFNCSKQKIKYQIKSIFLKNNYSNSK